MERPVKKIVLGDPVVPARPGSSSAGSPAPPPALAAGVGWLVPPLMMLAIAGGVWLILRGPDLLFGIALAALFGVGFLWVLVSSLLPGKPDRGCPNCKADALERLSPDSTSGVRCAACGFQDETASSWLIAEEEGPLERVVLRERAERKLRRRGGALPPEEIPR